MNNKLISTFSERLKQCLDMNPSLTATSLAEEIGLSKQAISMYISGDRKPKRPTVKVIADVLNVSEAWLMGYDTEMKKGDISLNSVNNLMAMPNTKKVPLLGTIACGEPILAVENVADYIDMDKETHADFALRCKGDSMINARIFDGDIVYIRRQNTVENGEIAAVLVEGMESEATLKRVYTSEDSIRLCAANPLYPDKIFEKEKMNDVTIIGKAVAFLSTVK